mgnify:FL=1
MKKFHQKEKKNRADVYALENIRLILKSIVKNMKLVNITRWNAVLRLSSLSKKGAKTRLVNRCILTSRKGRSTNSYRFSRLVFLRLVRAGNISGLTKSTW